MQKLSEIFKSITEQAATTEFLPTGFSKLDGELDGGFMRQELVVLGGPTGFGKSYVAGQIMANIARKGFKCAYFSLEISNKMVASRLVGAIANIKPTRLIHGLLKLDEFEARKTAEAELLAFEDFLYFYDNIYSLDQIIKEVKDNQFEFVIIDFIQNLLVRGVSDEYARLTQAAIELQKVAKEQNCCALVLSQLSNIVAREGARGKTTEYKGSGGIATASDLGFILERGDYNPDSEFQSVQLTLKKNRRGISGLEFYLIFKHPGGAIYET